MKDLRLRTPGAGTAALGCRVLWAALTVALLAPLADAAPITYTGFTITDGKLGSWEFHNARVYLKFQSDTRNVQFVQPPVDPTDPTQGTIDIYMNQTGKASVTIISDGKVVHATFAPHQIFVSVDLGHSDELPHLGGRGVGFGSFTATGGMEPTYPLGINEGTLHWGLIPGNNGDVYAVGTPSPALTKLSTNLKHDTRFSGNAWPCVGFPNDCTAPTPLHTDKGDLYLYLPYWLTYGDGLPANATGESHPTLSAGFFIARVGEIENENLIPSLGGTNTAKTTRSSAKPITYRGYVISDVILGGEHFSGAEVYLSFDADASTAVQFNNGSSYGFKNGAGNAHVTIVSGPRIVSAEFDVGQIYIYYDLTNAGIGFGSIAGGNGYPLGITSKSDVDYPASELVGYSTVQAVSDLTRNPSHASQYSPATASLATDLTNATALSGEASSCVAFDPVTSNCKNLTPIGLKTNHGEFYLFEPYTANGANVFSVNWGVFWTEVGQPKGDD